MPEVCDLSPGVPRRSCHQPLGHQATEPGTTSPVVTPRSRILWEGCGCPRLEFHSGHGAGGPRSSWHHHVRPRPSALEKPVRSTYRAPATCECRRLGCGVRPGSPQASLTPRAGLGVPETASCLVSAHFANHGRILGTHTSVKPTVGSAGPGSGRDQLPLLPNLGWRMNSPRSMLETATTPFCPKYG